MFCPKCGMKNEKDAKYCKGCGQSFQKDIHKPVENTENEDMSNSLKSLIIIIVILIGVLGVAAGMLYQKPSQIFLTQDTNDSNQQTTYQPTWHKVATFTGSSDDYRTFSIRGSKFKITMSAVPKITYNENSLLANIFDESGYMVGTGTINWGSTENPDKKEYVIPVSQGSGTYSVSIYAYDLESWTVTAWDYY